MYLLKTNISDVKLIEPKILNDNRGYFFESFRTDKIKALGIDSLFVQDNQSMSNRGTLRGLHYQLKNPQNKLVRVIYGEAYDVAVDIRKGSPTFGRHFGTILSD